MQHAVYQRALPRVTGALVNRPIAARRSSMSRTASRSLITLAAILCLPVIAAAQATQTATPAAKPMPTAKPATAAKVAAAPATATPAAATPSTAATARPHATAAAAAPPKAAMAAAPAAKPATTAAPTPTAAKPAAAAPATAAPAAAAGPARDARGRFIAKSAAPAAANHATCKDGTAWEGAQRSGACSRHGGVKSWS